MIDPNEYVRAQRLKEVHERLEKDDVFYFAKTLKIVGKKGGDLLPLKLNKAQLYAHNLVEEQKRKTGKVRAIIIKGRQQGFSTWIAGRFFKRTIKKSNMSTFIVSHLEKTTLELFEKVDIYHKNLPASLKPKKVKDNQSSMEFENGSSYTVGTAGEGDIGRGTTNQFLHLSEAAFYKNPDKIAAGIMNSVSDDEGTEVILETTVNGIGTWFHNMVKQALEGNSDYIVIFVPWFWEEGYRAPAPDNFALTPEEEELKELYELDDQQIQWRRNKKAIYKEEEKFRMEYPNSLEDAFMASAKSLFRQTKVEAAKKRVIKTTDDIPIICGVDASGEGVDSTAFVRRNTHKVLDYEEIPGVMDGMKLAGMIVRKIEEDYADMFFIDNAYGYDAIARLRELGYGDYVQGVYFAETNSMMYPETYLNKRAEIFGLARDWVEGYVNIPDDGNLTTQLLSIPNFELTSNGKFKLRPKKEIKRDNDVGMDIADAFALTFSAPVNEVKRKSVITSHNLRVNSGSNKIAKAGKPLLRSKERMKRR